ncbi:MAG: ATP-binding cassette domain-containing protein, partial [Acidobacteria bacterium]|nr:ATP-binding cassette domain-containing protein [Acidobacteriota bacterium]
FVFQFYNLMQTLSAERNVELPLLLTHLSRKERKKHAEIALNVVGLSHRARHYPRTLSGGEQQRVALARAVINSPAIILADEPTGNLDSENSEIVLEMFRELNQRFGQTIIMITHNPEAAEHCGKIIQMRDGMIIDE